MCDAVEYAVLGRGALDLDALERAFGRLRQEYPVLAGAVRTDERGSPELWFPAPERPALSVVEGDAGEAVGFEPTDRACALNVVRQGARFRVSLVVRHEIADGRASLEYFEALWAGYAAFVAGASPPDPDPKPLPLPAEAFLAWEGIEPLQAAEAGSPPVEAAPQSCEAVAAEPSDGVLRLRFRLSREETSALLSLGKARGVSAHGVVCAALARAELELDPRGSGFPAKVVSLVDLRPRLGGRQVRGADGTDLVGFATSVVHVDEAGDPLRWGEQILADLREQLREKRVHHSVFLPPQTNWASGRAEDGIREVSVTNWGVVPTLPPIDGFEVEDFHGSFLGKGLGGQSVRGFPRPGSWLVRSFDGRLGVELCFVSPQGPNEAEGWEGALRRAFDHLLAGAS